MFVWTPAAVKGAILPKGQQEMPFTKINEAIREVLDQCYVSQAPMAVLGTFIQRLSSDPAWSAAEVQEVRHKTIQILGILAEDASHDRS